MGLAADSSSRISIGAVESSPVSSSTSGCLGEKLPRAEELVSPAAEERRLTALEIYGHLPWDT
eukprot:6492088-Amphidinium_carterae.2